MVRHVLRPVRWQRVVVGCVVCVAVVATAACGDPEPPTPAHGEVLRELAGTAGPDPFTGSVAAITQADVTATTLVDAGTDATDVGTVLGSANGIYGGTLNEADCDPDRLVDFLEREPDKAAAWASVQGIDPSAISRYVDALTPVLLRQDTRVTNHGYREGRATPRQTVLQAGTAVLVDDRGVPRARCSCGNPLSEPEPTATVPVFAGAAWPTFDPTTIIVVVEATAAVAQFTLVDPAASGTFIRPAGTAGDNDQPIQHRPTSTTIPPTTAPPTSAPPAPTAPTYDEIAGSAVPSLCEHPATTLVDGRNPDIAPGNGEFQLLTQLPNGGESVVQGIPTNDAGDVTAVVASCNHGGVGWPHRIEFFSSGGVFYADTDLYGPGFADSWRSIGLPDGPQRDGIINLTQVGDELEVFLGAYRPTDALCCASATAVGTVVLRDHQVILQELTEAIGD